MKKIYTKIPRQKTIRDFIFKFFTHELKKGVDLTCFRSAVWTYKDKDCTIEQCPPNKYRSIDELFIIVKTEYPSCTIKKLIKTLFYMSINKQRFFPVDCNQIKRPTCAFAGRSGRSGIGHQTFEGSKYKSWVNLLKLININTSEDHRNLMSTTNDKVVDYPFTEKQCLQA